MISANPLRRNLWNTGPSLLKPGADWNDRWKRDVTRNPSLQRATDDDVWLETAGQRNELLRQLQARESGRKNQDDIEMLQHALNSGDVNLWESPENEYDAELQKMMQDHINAGIRGTNAQFSNAAIDRQRKQAIENLNVNRQLRGQSLDEAKYVDSRRRARDEFALDTRKAAENQQYRAALLRQRQQQMAEDARQDQQRGASAESRQALELVKDGMDPEEVIQLFQLNPRDQQLLRSYAATGDQNEMEANAPMLDYLNEQEMKMRRAVSPQIEAEENTGMDFRDKVGMYGGFISDALTFGHGPDINSNRRYAPLPIPTNLAGRAGLEPGAGDEFEELRAQAAQDGFRYDPNQRGFYSDRMDRIDRGAAPTAPDPNARRPVDPSLPLVTSKEQLRKMIQAGILRRGQQFRTYSGAVKTVF